MLDKTQGNRGEQPQKIDTPRDFTPGRYKDKLSTPAQKKSDVPIKAQELLGIDPPPSGIIPDKAKERLGLKPSPSEIQLPQPAEKRRTVVNFNEHRQVLNEQLSQPLPSGEPPPAVSEAIKKSLAYAADARSAYDKHINNLPTSSDTVPIEQAKTQGRSKETSDGMSSPTTSDAYRINRIENSIRTNPYVTKETKGKIFKAIAVAREAYNPDTRENSPEGNS